MTDFHQGIIPTLHGLRDVGSLKKRKKNIEELEEKIRRYSKDRPIALILPITPTEMEEPTKKKKPAFHGIIKELKKVDYVNEIIIPFGREGSEYPKKLDELKKLVSPLPGRKKIIWNRGKRIKELYKLLKAKKLDAGEDAKGRSVWMSYGYILADKEDEDYKKSQVIALHDCDIVNYKKDLITKLVYPVISETINSVFSKGYYSRHTNKMHGRVTRSFITPLVKSLYILTKDDYSPDSSVIKFIQYLGDFRYPLAGEFAMTRDLALDIRIPNDWGIEVGTLAQVFQNCTINSVRQTDLGVYEHKHQDLSAGDPSTGLHKMARDIGITIIKTLMGFGLKGWGESTFNSLRITYGRMARLHIEKYEADAEFNSLEYDCADEEENIKTFEEAIIEAKEEILKNPRVTNLIPNWKTVIAKIPDFTNELYKAVEEDSKGL